MLDSEYIVYMFASFSQEHCDHEENGIWFPERRMLKLPPYLYWILFFRAGNVCALSSPMILQALDWVFSASSFLEIDLCALVNRIMWILALCF
jgi:hypothetical protein